MGNLCGGSPPPSQGRGADGANIPGAVTTKKDKNQNDTEMGSKKQK